MKKELNCVYVIISSSQPSQCIKDHLSRHCLNNLAVMAKEQGRAGELGRLMGRKPGAGGRAVR